MSKHVVKVERGPTNTRINLPREILRKKGWLDVRYVIIEDHHEDVLILRRLFNGKAVKKQNS